MKKCHPNSMLYHPPTSAISFASHHHHQQLTQHCFHEPDILPITITPLATPWPCKWNVIWTVVFDAVIFLLFFFFLLKPVASVVLKLWLSQRQHSVICKYLCILFLLSQLRPRKLHKWNCLCMVLLTGDLSPEWTIRTFHADLLAVAMYILKA